MEQTLLHQIQEFAHSKSYEIYIYGSSALDLLSGRDIDVVSISPYYDIVKSLEIDVLITNNARKCNLYLVPAKIFFDDVYLLKYGGYYSHKFSLSFKLLSKNGESTNAPFIFWTQELISYRASESNAQLMNPETLSKFVHRKILQFRPSFIRPLSKYIANAKAQQYLLDYIRNQILPPKNSKTDSQQNSYDGFNENMEKAFYRFWDEYNKHKCKSNIWGEKTYKKMIYSCENINLAIIQEYFETLY